MVPGVVGSSPITHPTQRTGIGSDPNPCFLFSTQGCRQVVRQGTLTPSSAGSSPAIPARQQRMATSFIYASLAQSAEHLPFKQGVRGSNPRRGTKRPLHRRWGGFLILCMGFRRTPDTTLSEAEETKCHCGAVALPGFESPTRHQESAPPFGGADFCCFASGESKFIPGGEIPDEAPKKHSAVGGVLF